jgi:hypothetical protein
MRPSRRRFAPPQDEERFSMPSTMDPHAEERSAERVSKHAR